MNISVFGLGYVGCVATGCLAQLGHHVIGVDAQSAKVDFINQGKPTIIEERIAEIIAEGAAAGRIKATQSAAEAVAATEVSFICVGTPPTANGHLELAAILKVSAEIGAALRQKPGRHVIAIRSTVLPGTHEQVASIIAQSSGREVGRDFAVVSNPEFLREGTSVRDFFQPPYTILGSTCEWAIEAMQSVYRGIDRPVLTVAPKVAELLKYVCNSFHALKIVFANEVGEICKRLGLDSHELMEVFCRDTKLNISPAYLKPGFAYGGSCLPKDLKALRTIAHDHYVTAPVLEAIERSNEQQKEAVCRRILAFGAQTVGIIGLAFKAGTDDLRESPIVDVLERLLGKGVQIKIYDRHVHVSQLTGANRDYILQKIPYISRFITADLSEVVRGSELLVVVNAEPGLVEALENCGRRPRVFELSRVAGIAAVCPQSDGISW